jgi:NADPH2:quinone reductase
LQRRECIVRAYELHAYEGPSGLRLADRPLPEPDAESALVDAHAIGVNFPDLLITQGLYQLKPDLPFVPGCEVAGVVRSAPDGSGFAVGARVGAFIWQGGYAQTAPVPLSHLVRLPDAMSFEAAAALLVNHHTVHFALARRGRLEADETVLVLGAAGGIGTAAVQVAKGLGATVLGGVMAGPAAESQRAVALDAGADDVVLLEEGFARQVKERTGGRGVDVVLDPLGDWLFVEATRALAPEGRILVVGFAAGDIPTIRVNRLLLNNIAAVGVAWGASLARDAALLGEGSRALHAMFAEGTVRPQIGRRFAFEELPEALAALQAGQIRGKGVVTVPQP